MCDQSYPILWGNFVQQFVQHSFAQRQSVLFNKKSFLIDSVRLFIYFIYNAMVPTSTPKHSNKQGKTRYTARKCNKICLKQLYILVNEKQ